MNNILLSTSELSRILPIHLLPSAWASLLRELVCSSAVQKAALWVQTCLLTDLHMQYLGPVGSPFPPGAIWSPATFFAVFFPINDHIMFRWQQQPLPTSKGNSRSFWFLRKIPQQKRKSWALSCQPALLNYQQILHQWPRKSLEKYCFINPRSHSYHLENETHSFLSLRKKSSSIRIQRAILTKRLKRPFLRNPETRFGVRKIVSILHMLYIVSLDFHPAVQVMSWISPWVTCSVFQSFAELQIPSQMQCPGLQNMSIYILKQLSAD